MQTDQPFRVLQLPDCCRIISRVYNADRPAFSCSTGSRLLQTMARVYNTHCMGNHSVLRTHKRFKRTLISHDIDTQSANFRVNPLRQFFMFQIKRKKKMCSPDSRLLRKGLPGYNAVQSRLHDQTFRVVFPRFQTFAKGSPWLE